MPKVSVETQESVEAVGEIIEQLVSDPIKQFFLFKSLQERLNPTSDGRVSFRPHVLSYRRKAIMRLFTGNNYEEVAETLDIPVDTVKNDVRSSYKNGYTTVSKETPKKK